MPFHFQIIIAYIPHASHTADFEIFPGSGRTVKVLNLLESRDRGFLRHFALEDGAIGLIALANPFASLPIMKHTDWLLIMLREQIAPYDAVEHLLWQDYRLQVRRVTPETVEKWIYDGDRNGVQWLLQGDIIADEQGRLGKLRNMLEKRPALLREQKLLCEFSRFFVNYAQAKSNLAEGRVIDAYSHILRSLHHWAHISLLEQGVLPETTVWEQMRSINPGIYKLYEELTSSDESLEKRVQLLILACEFSVLSKLKSCCRLLLRVLEQKASACTMEELRSDDRLRPLPIDLPLLLQKLVHRGHVQEMVAPAKEQGGGKVEIRYALKKVDDRDASVLN